MIRAGKPWEHMLAGEAQSTHPNIIDLTEDSYVALKIVLNIIHLRFGEVPQLLGLDTLAELAVLTDKYMLTAVIAPWLKGWLEHLHPTIQESGNESSWLWISWEFGLSEVFCCVSHRLCVEGSLTRAPLEEPPMSLSEDQELLDSDEHQDELAVEEYHLSGPTGMLVSDALPPGTEDTILAKRHMIITKTLELLYSYFRNLRVKARSGVLRSLTAEDDTDASSLCPNQKHDCLLLQIGSLLCALESLDLWPEKDPDDIHISPQQLQELLSNIRLSDC